jgi:hypothetical protein
MTSDQITDLTQDPDRPDLKLLTEMGAISVEEATAFLLDKHNMKQLKERKEAELHAILTKVSEALKELRQKRKRVHDVQEASSESA